MTQLATCLWFDDQAEEAANFYVSVLRDGKLGAVSRYGKAASEMAGRPEGSVLIVEFEVEGQRFQALNGGPVFQFSEAVSFVIERDTQEEIDEVWDALTDGGEEQPCGWLKDRFGVSWQVVPSGWAELMRSSDGASERVWHAMMGMKKLDVDVLREAAAAPAAR